MLREDMPGHRLATGVNAIAVYVTDLESAKRFYVGMLGLEERGGLPPGVVLSAGSTTVYLEAGRKGKIYPGTGLPTISICFDTPSVCGAYEELKAKGVRVVEELRTVGDDFAMFRIADPDGNVVEFAGKP